MQSTQKMSEGEYGEDVFRASQSKSKHDQMVWEAMLATLTGRKFSTNDRKNFKKSAEDYRKVAEAMVKEWEKL